MLKLLWPLLIVKLRIPGLIWPEIAHFVQNSSTTFLPGDTRRTTSELPCRTPATHFWRKIRSLETQLFHISHFLQSDRVFGIVNRDSFMPSPVRTFARFQCPSCKLAVTPGQWSFSRLLISHWSIQISGRQPYARMSM